MADGHIKINTELNTDKIKVDLNNLKSMVSSTSKGIKNALESMGDVKSIDKVINQQVHAMERARQKADEYYEKIQKLQEEMSKMENEALENADIGFYTDTPKTIEKRAERDLSTNNDYQKLVGQLEVINDKWMEQNSIIETSQANIEALKEKEKILSLEKQKELELQGQINQINSALKDEQFLSKIQNAEQYNQLLQETFDKMSLIEQESEKAANSSGINYDDLIQGNEQYQQMYHQLMLLINNQDRFSQSVSSSSGLLSVLGEKFPRIAAALQGLATTAKTVRKVMGTIGDTLKPIAQKIVVLKNKLKSLIPHFNKAKNSGKSFGDNVANSAERGIKRLARMGLAVLGLRSAFMGVRKAINMALESNKKAQDTIATFWNGISRLIQPIITTVVSGLGTIMSYINSIYKVFTGKDLFKVVSGSAKKTADSTKKIADNAKEAKRQLAGFDEMQVLSSGDKSKEDSGGSGGGSPAYSVESFDVEDIKSKLLELFEPLENAWNKYGQPFTESFKNALTNIWELVKSIGKSFEDVWLNGTGEYTCSLILQILTNIFNIIGSLASKFSEAWNEAGLGTSIIQDLWDIFNDVLAVIKDITEGIKEFVEKIDWKPLLEMVKSVTGLFKDLFNIVSDTVSKIVDDLLNGDFSKAGNDLSKGLSNMIKTVTTFIENIDWTKLGKSVASIANKIVDFFNGIDWEKLAWDFVGLVESIVKGIEKAVKNFSKDFKAKDFKNMADKMIKALCTAIVECSSLVFTALTDMLSSINWEKVGESFAEISNAIVKAVGNVDWIKIADNIGAAIRGWAKDFDWCGFLLTILKMLLAAVKLGASAIWDIAAAIVGDLLEGMCDYLGKGANDLWKSIKNGWNNLKDKTVTIGNKLAKGANALWEWFSNGGFSKWSVKIGNTLKNGAGSLWNKFKGTGFGKWSISIANKLKDSASSLFSGFKKTWDKAAKKALNVKLAIGEIVGNVKKWINTHFVDKVNKYLPDFIHLPHLAKGGIVNVPTQFIAGEAGQEAVLPLQNHTEWMDVLAGKIVEKMDVGNNQGNTTIILKVGDQEFYRWLINMQRKNNLVMNGG